MCLHVDENHTLTIISSENIVDTGAYKCKAKNSAGVSQDIATVFVEKVDVPKYINGRNKKRHYLTTALLPLPLLLLLFLLRLAVLFLLLHQW